MLEALLSDSWFRMYSCECLCVTLIGPSFTPRACWQIIQDSLFVSSTLKDNIAFPLFHTFAIESSLNSNLSLAPKSNVYKDLAVIKINQHGYQMQLKYVIYLSIYKHVTKVTTQWRRHPQVSAFYFSRVSACCYCKLCRLNELPWSHDVLFIVLSGCCIFEAAVSFCGGVVSLTGAKRKAASLITTHSPQT